MLGFENHPSAREWNLMSVQATRVTEGSYFGSVITIGVLFFIFGFVTWLNGPMITFVSSPSRSTT